jgi:hypothetical protein
VLRAEANCVRPWLPPAVADVGLRVQTFLRKRTARLLLAGQSDAGRSRLHRRCAVRAHQDSAARSLQMAKGSGRRRPATGSCERAQPSRICTKRAKHELNAPPAPLRQAKGSGRRRRVGKCAYFRARLHATGQCEVSRFDHRPSARAAMRDGARPAPAFSGRKPANTRHCATTLRRDEAPPHHPSLVPLAMASITSSASAVLGRRSRSSVIKSARRAAVADGSPKDDRKAAASASDDLTAFGFSASTRETIQPTQASCVSIRIGSLRPGSAASRGRPLLAVSSSRP